MYIKNSNKYKKRINVIQPGEYFISDKDEMISTLLGSCVSVCLHDPVRSISGMNHFMLPGKISESDIYSDKSAKFGITAINYLIHRILELGAKKEDLTASIYGGGHILENEMDMFTVPVENIRLAKVLLELEDIPIVDIDVGNNYTRKLYMEVRSGKIQLEKSSREDFIKKIALRDMEFANNRFAKNGKN